MVLLMSIDAILMMAAEVEVVVLDWSVENDVVVVDYQDMIALKFSSVMEGLDVAHCQNSPRERTQHIKLCSLLQVYVR
jgi:hypothetical protein